MVTWRPIYNDLIRPFKMGVNNLQRGHRGYFPITQKQVVILSLRDRIMHVAVGLLLLIPVIGQIALLLLSRHFLLDSSSSGLLQRGVGWISSVSSKPPVIGAFPKKSKSTAKTPSDSSPVQDISMEEYLHYFNKPIYDLQSAPQWVRSCKEIVLKAVQQMSGNLIWASDELKASREVVMAAVKNDGMALNYAHDNLKNDKGLVIEAVKQWGLALQFASVQLRDDLDVVITAYKQHNASIQYASKRLQTNCELAFALDLENQP